MNSNSNLLVLFDSPSDFDDLVETISNSKSKIISFDYDTHKILNDKKIKQLENRIKQLERKSDNSKSVVDEILRLQMVMEAIKD